ncbi:MAG TPA: PepSY domain-containing protein [Sphingorhabdus sp.]|nr:PepSY domain-containing protein [Sphingorhabdus sp.]
MRKAVRKLHLWLGLSLGCLLVLLGLTGSLLVFYTEIDGLLHPEIAVQQSAAPDWDRALLTVRSAYPQKTGPWRFEVKGDGRAIPARYYNPPETAGRDFAPMMIWLAPDGSRILRRDFWGDYAMTFIYDLHYRLLLGKTGAVVVGYSGLAIFLLLLSGLWAWWPRGSLRKALKLKLNGATIRRLRDQHKMTGLISLLPMLLLSATGVALSLPEETEAVLRATVGPIEQESVPQMSAKNGTPISVQQAVSLAQIRLPDAKVRWIYVPGAGDGLFTIRMQQPGDPSDRFPHSFVHLDKYDGRIVAVSDTTKAGASSTVLNWLHPLHDGSAGGIFLRVLWALLGLAPLILAWTGWRRWQLRQKV